MKSQLRWCLLLLISAKSNGDLITFEITEPSQFASRPSSSLNVTVVDLTIHNFIFLNLQQTNLLLDINVTLKWFDHRFGISPSTDECRSYTRSRIESNDVDSVWRPKLNFHGNQEAQIQELPYKNEFLWYDSDGIMLYQQHYKLKIPCKITLDRFPMDEAACFINFGAIEYDDTKVKLKWNSQNAPISILANRHLEEHSLHTHYVKSVKSVSKFISIPKILC